MPIPHATTHCTKKAQHPALLRFCLVVLALCLFMSLAGCATKSSPHAEPNTTGQTTDQTTGQNAGQTTDQNAGQNAGPHAPSSPSSPSSADTAGPRTPLLRYSADFAYADAAPPATPPSAPNAAPPATTKAAATAAPPPELLRALNAASLLLKLKDSAPDDVQGLEFRIDKDEAEARRLLQAFGYYDGTVHRSVLPPHAPGAANATSATSPAPWRVRLTLSPGQPYTVGETVVRYVEEPALAPAPGATPPSASQGIAGLPASLEDAGLTPGSPAEASRILRAVERLPEILGQRGFPLAEVKGTRYAVDKDTRQLFATVLVQTGPRARMGRVVMRGDSQVQPAYLEKLRHWQTGMAWDQRMVEDYRDMLVRQGLFRSIELQAEPAAHAAEPLPSSAASAAPTSPSATKAASATPVYDLVATLADAPQRTVGGGLNYESNRGPGVQAYWEHRNLLGQGERFRAEASLWEDSQFARATLRKPAFLDRSQELTADAWLRNEDTDAYKQRAAWLSAGLERRLWGPLFASAGLAVEGGDLEDPTHPRRGYTMAGVPVQVRYEGASGPGGGQLDPERGLRATLGVRPAWGEYGGSFFITPTRLTLSGYVPMGSVGVDADTGRVIPRMVLAARGAAGTLWRGDSQRIPAAARYYGGGGGSVRGYAYQSLGPRDVHNDPLGGASFAELSLEARVRITENIAIVPFLDGGNVYSGVTPGFERDGTTTGLQWGAGLGLRYHTVVGPLRLDVATPLNPRKDDGKFFLYISIGQSF